jgi:protein TonB
MRPDTLDTRLPPAGDRLLTTCFLAALLHAIVLLGVTFTASKDEFGDQSPGLEVILVKGGPPGEPANPGARYLAQRNQAGSGNSRDPRRALIPRSSPVRADTPGSAAGAGIDFRQAGVQSGNDPLLSSLSPSTRILYFASPVPAEQTAALPLRLEDRSDLDISANDDGIELRLRGEAKHRLWIAADTRASDLAVYLDGWRRKVERVGTLNFPDVARRNQLSGTPVVEVTIDAKGRLAKAVLRRSSGDPEIDAAAIRILRLAAPFDPFPRELSAKHDEIRIAYEWQFLGGATEGSRVSYGDAAGDPQTSP